MNQEDDMSLSEFITGNKKNKLMFYEVIYGRSAEELSKKITERMNNDEDIELCGGAFFENGKIYQAVRGSKNEG